jgi:hypothetical protein
VKPSRSSSNTAQKRPEGVHASHSHTNAAAHTTKCTSAAQTRITGQRFYSPQKQPAFFKGAAAASASNNNVAARAHAAEKRSNSTASRDTAASAHQRTRTATATSSVSSTSRPALETKTTQTQGRMVKLSESGLPRSAALPPPPPPPPTSSIPTDVIDELNLKLRSHPRPATASPFSRAVPQHSTGSYFHTMNSFMQ